MKFSRIGLGSLFFNTTVNFNHMERAKPCAKANLYSGQPRILTVLSDHEGCTLRDLSDFCHIGMPSLSVSVRNMEKAGLIVKGPGLRNQQLMLTDEGRGKVQVFHEEIDRFFSSYFEAVGEEKAHQFFDRLKEFNRYIEIYMSDIWGETPDDPDDEE